MEAHAAETHTQPVSARLVDTARRGSGWRNLGFLRLARGGAVMDTYSTKDNAARCSECAKFMPWSRSRQVERDSGIPAGAPALVEIGVCKKCQERIAAESKEAP